MKYCAQCGERLNDASMFCSNCGAKQPGTEKAAEAVETAVDAVDNAEAVYEEAEAAADAEGASDAEGAAEAVFAEAAGVDDINYAAAEAPVKKKKRTGLWVGLGIAAAAIIAIVALMVTSAYANLIPHSKLKLALAERKLYNGAVETVTRELPMTDGISANVDLTFDIDAEDPYGYMSGYLDIINDIKLGISFDTRENLDLGIRGEYKGNTAADLRLFVDEDKLGLYIAPADDDVYTMTRTALLEKIAPELDPEKTDFLFKKLDREAVKKDVDAITAIVGKALKDADIKIEKNAPICPFNEEGEIKAAVYTVTLTEEQMKTLLTDIADYIESDDCYIGTYAADLFAMLNEAGASADLDLDEIIGDLELIEGADETFPTFDELMAKLREQIPEAAERYVEEGWKLEAVMKGNDIIRQRIYNNEGQSCGYDSITNGATTRTAFRFDRGDGDVYIRDELRTVNGSVVQSHIDVIHGDDTVTACDATYDTSKKDVFGAPEGTWNITLSDGENGLEALVQIYTRLENGGMTYDINFVPSEDMNEGGIYTIKSMQFHAHTSEISGVEKPAGAKEVDISDYSDVQLGKLFTGIVYKLYGNINKIFG